MHQLKPGDKVKFRGDHPWKGEIGEYIEDIRTLVGTMAKFRLLRPGADMETAARPAQWTPV